MADIIWERDPAASGWRSRAFLPKWQLIAYDDGRWCVNAIRATQDIASGIELDGELAKKRAIAVYVAMSSSLPL